MVLSSYYIIIILYYEDEPLADCGEEVSPNANEEETDTDGLTPST